MTRSDRFLERLKGPIVPINLCFGDGDAIDFPAIRRYVNWLCEQGAPVLLLTYGSSEFASLTDSDIGRLTMEVGEEIAGRALYITATGWWPPATCRDFLRFAATTGADAVKVQIHPYLGARREVLTGYFDAIEDAADLPLLLWGAWATGFPVETVAELAKRPNIVGIKNDGDPFYVYYDLIRATAGERFAVISGGQMRNFMFGYPLGSPAYLCPVAPFRPDLALAFYKTLSSGETDAAWQLVFQYEEPWLKAAEELDWLPSIKSALHPYGIYPNHRLRAPAHSHTPEEYDRVAAVLDRVFGPIAPVNP